MKIIKNQLNNIHTFLSGATLKGASSRARTKLDKQITEALNEIGIDEKQLVIEHGGLVDEQGNIIFENTEQGQQEKMKSSLDRAELFKESLTLVETTEGYYDKLKNALQNYEYEIDGPNALGYDSLLDALEEEK